jgi:uncharacterized membrane protein YdbT with pleckstrin-like domain
MTDSTLTQPDGDRIEPLAETGGHWSVFLPALLVAILYGVLWLLLDLTGRGSGALARLIFLVLIAAPPLLLAHAFLRFYSTGVAVTRQHILVARGWPRHMGEQIPLKDVESATLRVSRLSRLLGVGGIHIRLWDGNAIDARDLADPSDVVETIRKRLRVEKP